MKKSITILFTLAMVLIFLTQAHADLSLLGQGTSTTHGTYNLIYDTALDITWFDYSNYGATIYGDTWQSQLNWAAGLEVIFGDSTYTEWRLPSSSDPGCSGYSCTNNEMGHLYWELGNSSPGPLTYTGDFQDLKKDYGYWTGTQYDINNAIAYFFVNGSQYPTPTGNSFKLVGLAVHAGELAPTVVPEPISSTLFVVGAATLGFRRMRKKITN